MFRQDTYVGLKMLIIIKNQEELSSSMKIAKKVFKKYMGFREMEILELTLEEAYKLYKLF
jgi:hypothetical protein